eukprot:11203236-Lingulodinium_polyedra.AAC.1
MPLPVLVLRRTGGCPRAKFAASRSCRAAPPVSCHPVGVVVVLGLLPASTASPFPNGLALHSL